MSLSEHQLRQSVIALGGTAAELCEQAANELDLLITLWADARTIAAEDHGGRCEVIRLIRWELNKLGKVVTGAAATAKRIRKEVQKLESNQFTADDVDLRHKLASFVDELRSAVGAERVNQELPWFAAGSRRKSADVPGQMPLLFSAPALADGKAGITERSVHRCFLLRLEGFAERLSELQRRLDTQVQLLLYLPGVIEDYPVGPRERIRQTLHDDLEGQPMLRTLEALVKLMSERAQTERARNSRTSTRDLSDELPKSVSSYPAPDRTLAENVLGQLVKPQKASAS